MVDATWTYKTKLDGFRAEVIRDGADTTLYSRNANIVNDRFPYIAKALSGAAAGFIPSFFFPDACVLPLYAHNSNRSSSVVTQSRYDRQLDRARLQGAMVDPLGRLAVILGLGIEDIGNKSLRVSIIERKPA